MFAADATECVADRRIATVEGMPRLAVDLGDGGQTLAEPTSGRRHLHGQPGRRHCRREAAGSGAKPACAHQILKCHPSPA
jgi:hypothetical protein